MRDLQKIDENIKSVRSQIRECTKCQMSDFKSTLGDGYGSPVPGIGAPTARMMLFGEAPGRDEVDAGKPFVGKAGKLLREAIQRSKIDPSLLYVANVIHCRPENNKFDTVSAETIQTCDWWKRQFAIIRPLLVVGLGGQPWKHIFGQSVGMTLNCGLFFDFEIKPIGYKGVYMQTLHPSFCLREGNPGHQNPIMAMTSEQKKQLLFDNIEAAVRRLDELIAIEQGFNREVSPFRLGQAQ